MLPDFKGRLGAAPWASFKLTDQVEVDLALSALPACAGCRGKGWTGEKSSPQLCHCVLRRDRKKS